MSSRSHRSSTLDIVQLWARRRGPPLWLDVCRETPGSSRTPPASGLAEARNPSGELLSGNRTRLKMHFKARAHGARVAA
jgi:hypothetical protein